MSKERLEEIEAKYSTLTITSERGGIEYTEVDVKDLVFLIQNGFEQVKRVQDLEKRIRVNSELFDMLAHQNKLYRENIENACHKASEILEIDEIINEVLEESE